MQNKLRSAVAGSMLLASSGTGMTAPLPESSGTGNDILLSDEAVTIRQHPVLNGINNNLVVICPSNDFHGDLTLFQPEQRTKPQVILGQNPYEEIKTMLTNAFERNADIRNAQFPTFNMVFVDRKGGLHPAYTLNNIMQTFGQLSKEDLSGADSRDPKFLAKVRDHAVNFCFSMF